MKVVPSLYNFHVPKSLGSAFHIQVSLTYIIPNLISLNPNLNPISLHDIIIPNRIFPILNSSLGYQLWSLSSSTQSSATCTPYLPSTPPLPLHFLPSFNLVPIANLQPSGTMSDFANAQTGAPQSNGTQDPAFAQGTMPSSNESSKTLWMGEMEAWMDENFIKNIFSTLLGEAVQVKVIRDRNSG